MKQLKRIILSTIAVVAIMLLSICLLSKLDFLPGMSESARAADYDVTFRIANDGDGGKITATSGNNSVTVMLEGGLNTDCNNTTITVEPYEGYCLGDIRVFHDGSELTGVLNKKSDNTYQLLTTVASYYEVVVSFEPNDGHRINITNKSIYAISVIMCFGRGENLIVILSPYLAIKEFLLMFIRFPSLLTVIS